MKMLMLNFPIIPEQCPSVYVRPAQGLQDSFNSIIRWILLVLCLWSSFCVISDNAMEILLELLRAVFESLVTVVPVLGILLHYSQNHCIY